jgi:hypothetical protein
MKKFCFKKIRICSECGKKLGFLEGYRHPVDGKKSVFAENAGIRSKKVRKNTAILFLILLPERVLGPYVLY